MTLLNALLALGVRLMAAFALATMGMLVKLAGERGAHLIELIFWRQLLTLVLLGAGLALTGRLAMLKTQRLPAHARRALSGLFGMIFTYGAVLLLPLTEATTLGFTAPVFAVLIAIVLFRERIGPYRWGAVAMGFAGSDAGVVSIEGLGYYDPDILTFYGSDEAGLKMQLIQHVSQLSVMLQARPKAHPDDAPRRIGFRLTAGWSGGESGDGSA